MSSPCRPGLSRIFPLPVLALALTGVLTLALATPVSAQDRQAPSDRALAEALAERLGWDPRLRIEGLKVDVREGVVTLQGSVASLMEKTHAARVASSRVGVRSVVNTITVEAGSAGDEQLVGAVKGHLKRHPVTEGQPITVAAQEGFVTLGGGVDRFESRALAEEIVAEVPGVRGVYNQITVDYEKGKRDDDEIAAHVQQRLASDVWLADAVIVAKVNESVVNLSGRVGTLAQLERATRQAWVPGVMMVNITDLEIHDYRQDPTRRKVDAVLRSDGDLEASIRDALDLHPWVAGDAVTVSVKEGVATLEGHVRHYGAKTAARQTAENTVGIQRVDDLVTVAPVRPVADEELLVAVQTALQDHPRTKPYALSVAVTEGVVFLQGPVETPFEQRQAEVVAAAVPGVRDIVNRIEVSRVLRGGVAAEGVPPDSPGNRLDNALKDRIERELYWTGAGEGDEVEVKVRDGVATLRGEVASVRAMRMAVRAALSSGAHSVVNELQLEERS